MHPPPTYLPFLIMIPLLIWRMYSRVKRSIGRQTLSRRRPWFTIVIFPLFLVILSVATRGELAPLGALAGGAVGGVLLGIYGLGKTKFEATPQGLFYTPNAHIGIALSVLFVGRVISASERAAVTRGIERARRRLSRGSAAAEPP